MTGKMIKRRVNLTVETLGSNVIPNEWVIVDRTTSRVSFMSCLQKTFSIPSCSRLFYLRKIRFSTFTRVKVR